MGEHKPSDFDSSLPDNKAEYQASKDARKETPREKREADARAKQGTDSLWSSIFGGKNK